MNDEQSNTLDIDANGRILFKYERLSLWQMLALAVALPSLVALWNNWWFEGSDRRQLTYELLNPNQRGLRT